MDGKEKKEFCKATAKTIMEQLFWSIDKWTYFSWGVSTLQYGFYQEMPTLMLKVSGMIHKGWVYISLNEGKDVYEVRLVNNKRIVKKTLDEVFCDQLGHIIDTLIEKPESMNDETYHQKAMQDSERKFNRAKEIVVV